RRHVSADRHAAAPRRRAAQLPADGPIAGARDGRGGPVTLGRAHSLLRHVDRVRGPDGDLRPYGSGAARRDGHVCRGLKTRFPAILVALVTLALAAALRQRLDGYPRQAQWEIT